MFFTPLGYFLGDCILGVSVPYSAVLSKNIEAETDTT